MLQQLHVVAAQSPTSYSGTTSQSLQTVIRPYDYACPEEKRSWRWRWKHVQKASACQYLIAFKFIDMMNAAGVTVQYVHDDDILLCLTSVRISHLLEINTC